MALQIPVLLKALSGCASPYTIAYLTHDNADKAKYDRLPFYLPGSYS